MPTRKRRNEKCKLFLYFTPCGHCGKDCGEESQSIFCDICCKWFHRKCKNLTLKEYFQLGASPDMYICGDKCKASLFPFNEIDDINFESTIFGDGLFPCKICSQDCMDGMDCLQCDVCDHWIHTDCRFGRLNGDNDGFSAHDVIVDNHYEVICSEKCYMSLLPFSDFKYGTLLKSEVFLPKKNKVSSLKKALSRPTSDPIFDRNPKKFVKFNKFLDINCSYLKRNELKDNYFGDSELVIFHNNVRSLNKNIGSVRDIFGNCTKWPDILAISETKLKEDKDFPELEGFSFECVDSPTDAGGVGVYLSNQINYCLRKDLDLGARHCEDLWLDIELDNKKFVFGVIYRHPGHKYNSFCDKLCNTLNMLNKSKSNYIIVGDFNIDLLKYNLVTPVTDYVNSLHSMGCNVSVDLPTRVTCNSSTCIDHIF